VDGNARSTGNINNDLLNREIKMNENKRKQIEAKLLQLFTQTDKTQHADSSAKATPHVVKVIRRRKGKPDLQVA
jgi:hypothetical protein